MPNGTPSSNLPTGEAKPPEDILASAEPTPPPAVGPTNIFASPPSPPRSVAETASEPEVITSYPEDSSSRVKILIGVIAAVIIVLVGVGAWLIWRQLNIRPAAPVQSTVEPITATPPITTPIPPVAPIILPTVVDSDSDGLSDEEERSLGLDINNPDTDGDGLLDREEVKIYQTDPKNKDTDGDGYTDGTEVANGYNPKGPGRLLDLERVLRQPQKQ